MTRSRYSLALILIASAFALTACVAPDRVRYNDNVPYTDQSSNSAPPNATYFRGSQGPLLAPNSNDVTINANVVSAVSSVPGMQASSIQVTTYNAVVTLRGTVDNQSVAQNAVQAARQVQGVQRVDYDLRVAHP